MARRQGRMGALALLLGSWPSFTAVTHAEVVLNVWLNTQSPQATDVMVNKIIPAFQAQNPGVKVNFLTVGWGQREEKLKVAFAGNVAPDVYEIGSDMIQADVVYGFPRPLDDYLRTMPDRRDFIPQSWEPTRWNGKQYGVPFTLTGRFLFYFVSVLEEAGFDAQAPPDTWEAIAAAARKLHKVQADGRISRLGVNPGWYQAQAFYHWLWMNGGEVVEETTGKPLFNSPEGRETLEYWLDLHRAQGLPAPAPSFLQRGVGIAWGSPHSMSRQVRDADESLFNELRMYVPMRKGRRVWPLYVNSLAISSQSRHPDLAWKFIQHFVSLPNAIEYLRAVGIFSPRLSALNTPYVRRENAPVAGLYGMAEWARRNFLFPGVNRANPMVGQYLEAALTGQRPVPEALERAAFEWQKIADEFTSAR